MKMQLTSEYIWTKFNKELNGFILSRVHDKDTCNDILQDVFLKIHLNLDKVKEQERVQSWVYQIARNAVTDHFRKEKPHVKVEEMEIPEEISEKEHAMTNCLEPHINKLPGKYKEAITLVELKGYSQLKLAEKLNISYSAAKSRVQRGRELLRSYFESCCNIVADKYGNIISHSEKQDCPVCKA